MTLDEERLKSKAVDKITDTTIDEAFELLSKKYKGVQNFKPLASMVANKGAHMWAENSTQIKVGREIMGENQHFKISKEEQQDDARWARAAGAGAAGVGATAAGRAIFKDHKARAASDLKASIIPARTDVINMAKNTEGKWDVASSSKRTMTRPLPEYQMKDRAAFAGRAVKKNLKRIGAAGAVGAGAAALGYGAHKYFSKKEASFNERLEELTKEAKRWGTEGSRTWKKRVRDQGSPQQAPSFRGNSPAPQTPTSSIPNKSLWENASKREYEDKLKLQDSRAAESSAATAKTKAKEQALKRSRSQVATIPTSGPSGSAGATSFKEAPQASKATGFMSKIKRNKGKIGLGLTAAAALGYGVNKAFNSRKEAATTKIYNDGEHVGTEIAPKWRGRAGALGGLMAGGAIGGAVGSALNLPVPAQLALNIGGNIAGGVAGFHYGRKRDNLKSKYIPHNKEASFADVDARAAALGNMFKKRPIRTGPGPRINIDVDKIMDAIDGESRRAVRNKKIAKGLAGGALLGLGAYGAYKANQNHNSALEDIQRDKQAGALDIVQPNFSKSSGARAHSASLRNKGLLGATAVLALAGGAYAGKKHYDKREEA